MIKLVANDRLRRDYQALLRRDFDERTLEHALRLLERMLRLSGVSPDPAAQQVSWLLREYMGRLGDGLLPRVPVCLPNRRGEAKARASRLAGRVRTLLLFPQEWTGAGAVPDEWAVSDNAVACEVPDAAPGPVSGLSGEVGLFRDTQSVAFLCTIFSLLPAVRPMRPEHDLLLHVLNAHSLVCWQRQPAHQQFLRGLFFDYLEEAGYLADADLSIQALRTSFNLTAVSEHDYLTKAQIYWSHLLDAGKAGEAEAFALWLYRNAPQQHLDEVREMIRDTYPWAAA